MYRTTFIRACLVLFLLLGVTTFSIAKQSAEWAKGELIIEGARISLHHAYIRETYPGDLQITISDAVLDRALVKDAFELMDQARAGKFSVLEIRVAANGQGQISAGIYDQRLKDGMTGGPDIGQLDATISPKLADGTFTISEMRMSSGQTIQCSVKFHATGLSGKIRNFDDVLDSAPSLRRFLDRASDLLSAYTGPIAVGGFAALVILFLLWALVIAPRRSQKILKELEKQGYTTVDPKNAGLAAAISKLTPYSIEGPIKPDFREHLRNVIGARVQNRTYIVNVSQRHDSFRSSNTIWQTLFLQERLLPFSDDVYIRPRSADKPHAAGRHTRFELREINADDLNPEFQRHYCVSTKNGVSVDIPSAVQEKLLVLGHSLIQPEQLKEAIFRKDLLWGVNIKFCREGWGICASSVWLEKEKMKTLVKVGEGISQSLNIL